MRFNDSMLKLSLSSGSHSGEGTVGVSIACSYHAVGLPHIPRFWVVAKAGKRAAKLYLNLVQLADEFLATTSFGLVNPVAEQHIGSRRKSSVKLS